MDEDRYYGKDLEAAKRFIMNNLSQLKWWTLDLFLNYY